MSNEDEGFLEAKARRKRGTRGKPAEEVVHKALALLRSTTMSFDFDRLLDSRAAGKIVSPTVSDFTFCYRGRAGALEAKSTKHDYRLSYSDFPQYPRMLRRAEAGALCLVAVCHSEIKRWRLVNVLLLPFITKGSWDLSEHQLYPSFDIAFEERLS